MPRVDIVYSAPATRADGSALDPSDIASCTVLSAGRTVATSTTPGAGMKVTDSSGMPSSTYTVRTVLNDGTTSETTPVQAEVVPGPAPALVESVKFYG